MSSSEQSATATAHDIVHELSLQSVTIRAVGDQLRLDGATDALGAAQVARIREHKPALLAALQASAERMQHAGMPAPPAALSRAQRALAGLAGATSWCALAAEADGRLDEARLASAFRLLRGEHALLRASRADVLAQRCPAAAVEAEDAFVTVASERPLDDIVAELAPLPAAQSEAPLLRLILLRRAQSDTIVLLADRLAADIATLRLILAALARDSAETPPPRPAPVARYADFAFAQERLLAHPLTVRRIVASNRVADAFCAACPDERRAVHDTAVAEVGVWLAPVAASLGASVSMLQFGAFVLALHARVATAPVVALSCANRASADFAGVLGPTQNVVPLTFDVSGTPRLRDALARLRDGWLDASAAQEIPWQALAPAGMVARHAFTHAGPLSGTLDFGGHRVSVQPAIDAEACGAMRWIQYGERGASRARIVYDTAVFSAAEIVEMAESAAFLLAHLRELLDTPLDRLPADAAARAAALRAFGTDDPLVEALCGIFSDVLGAPRVAPTDNFFELAGNSLAVAKVVSRVKRQFEVALSFSEVFRHPTPAQLALLVRGREASVLPVFGARPRRAELPASPQQERYFQSYNIAIGESARMTVLVHEWDDATAFCAAVDHVVQRHELLRTAFFTADDGALWQRIHAHAPLPIEDVVLATDSADARRREIEAAIRRRRFDLTAPPLVKVLLHRRADGSALSAVGVFNGILDAYSESTLERELHAAYALACTDGLTQREPLALQYQDFCQWQHETASSPLFERSRQYWQALYPADYRGFHLRGASPAEPRRGAMYMFLLGEALSEQARAAAAAAESSLFGYLLANFFELAGSWYARDDVSVGLLYHGRENEELEDLVGYFVDLFCLRCDLEAGQDFGALVRRVNEQLFRAVDLRSYQYHHLAAHLGRSPTDTVFPVTGFHVNNVIVPGREKRIPADFVDASVDLPYAPKFDFNIYLHESDRGIFIRMAYATTVVSPDAAIEFARRFVRTVERNVQIPGNPAP